MFITQYRWEKDNLRLRTLQMSVLVESLRKEIKSKPVSALRENLPYLLPGNPNKYAQRLAKIAFGVVYKKLETEAEVRKYTGLVLLDINYLTSGQDVVKVREQAAAMPQTLLAFIGSSGRSVKVVVPFVLPDGSLPDDLEQAELFHAYAYSLAVRHYQPLLMCNITLKEPNIEQTCTMSVDENLYYNPDALPIRISQPQSMPDDEMMRIIPRSSEDKDKRLMPGLTKNYIMVARYSLAYANAVAKLSALSSLDMNMFLIELAQNCYKADVPEEDAVQWTLLYEGMKIIELQIRAVFRSVYGLKKMQQKKWSDGMPEIISISLLLDEFMKRRYDLRKNVMTGEVEYHDHSLVRLNFRPFGREARNTMCMEAHREGLNVWDKDIERYVYSDSVPEFHPVNAYFSQLPPWDGQDHIRTLARRVKCDNSHWEDYFFRWFLGMVAHWQQMDLEHGNSTVPLLVGNQGCGKSTFCLQLLPPELRMFYTDSIDFGSRRDTEMALHRYLLINIDEFETVKPGQQSYVKHVLQKASISTRMPYQAAFRQLSRYGAFIATANNFDLLTDPTGSRRFICIEVQETIDTYQPVNYEQLYAQALDLLTQGERYWFTREEEADITLSNGRFQQISVEEQYFCRYFAPAQDREDGEELLPTEILERIRKYNKDFVYSGTMVRRFGRVLKRLGIPCRHTRYGTRYLVKCL